MSEERENIRCPKCNGNMMMRNLISWPDSLAAYRPVYKLEEEVTLEATCIACQHKLPLKGILKILEAEV